MIALVLLVGVHFSHKIHDGTNGFERYKCSHCHQLDAGREFKPLPPPLITQTAIAEPNLRGPV